MANPFILDALNVKPDYRQMRQDDLNALNIQKQMVKMSDEDKYANQKALNDFSKIMNIGGMASKGYLAPDAKRINDKFLSNMKPVYEQLKKFHGNEARFFADGGNSMMMSAVGNLQYSPELNQAIINKELYNQHLKDRQNGVIEKDLPDGTTFEKALEEFSSGKRTDYPYVGGIQPPSVDITKIMSMESPYGEGSYMSTHLFNDIVRASNPNHVYTDNEIQKFKDMGYFKGLFDPANPNKTLIPYKPSRPVKTSGSNKSGSGKDDYIYQDILNMNKLSNNEFPVSYNKSNQPMYETNILTGLKIYGKESGSYGIIDRVKKRADGKYSVFVRNSNDRYGVYDDLWSLYADAIRSSYENAQAEKILNKAAEIANKYGYAKSIGAPEYPLSGNTPSGNTASVKADTMKTKSGRTVIIR